VKILDINSEDFIKGFDEILKRGKMDIDEVSGVVKSILDDIKRDGNSALKRDIEKFDRWSVGDDSNLEISKESMRKAYDSLDSKVKDALHLAYSRIEKYHKNLMPKSWLDFEKDGTLLGQKVTPVERAGLYIPGGKAVYPSSLLMNAIPAIVAGVEEIIVSTPTPDGEINELLLSAMYICDISRAFRVGGASAIGAMAYGTQTIPKVDVITGPGNIFVATAKKLVYGDVNIDMIAGPSEICVIADESANSKHIAVDLLSQAEHDEMASSILITTSKKFAEEVLESIEMILKELPREEIARASIENRGAVIIVNSLKEATELSNQIAPEHLEIVTKNPMDLLPTIKHAGAIFLGKYSPEAIGDYIAGPNHTLPTGGTAKFYSPLGVEHFLKKSSIISMSKNGFENIANECAIIAEIEGLDAHKKSVTIRL